MEKELISVITVTRNRGALLGRCISSVLSQSYDNIEHIVVDGASTDNTDEVISSFNDPRLKYIKLSENLDIVDTINLAFEESKGNYITFLDSDDEYKIDKVEKQLKLIKSLPSEYGMVYCWMSYFDNNTKELKYEHKTTLRGFVGKEVVSKPKVSGTPTFFFRRDVFKELGGWKHQREIGIISDWELGARYCQKWRIDYVPESLVNVYVNHGLQQMTVNRDDYYSDRLRNEIKFHDYFLKEYKNIFDESPSKASYHYYEIANAYMKLKEWRNAFPFYLRMIRYNHSIYYICLPLIRLIKK